MPHPVGGAMGVTLSCADVGRGHTRFEMVMSIFIRQFSIVVL